MSVGTITKQSVDALKPSAKEEYLWDPKVSGFGVKVTPTGSKSYLVQYRMGGRGTPTRRVTIGKHGAPWAPAQARTEAERILALVKKGTDPQEQKVATARESVDLAFDKYVERFLSIYGVRHWNPKTLSDSRRYLTSPNSPVRPVLWKKALPAIKRPDIAAVFDAVPAEKPGYARNLYTALKKLFTWAVGRGDIERSPFEGFEAPRVVASRDRVLTDDELRLAWLACGEMGYPFGKQHRLLIATGQRREEVSSLDWRELNRDRREWTLPSSRAKNDKSNIVPLNELAIAELDGVAGGEEWPSKGFVFTTTGKTAISGFSKAKARLDETMLALAIKEDQASGGTGEGVEIQPWRAHDLRRTFATGMQRLGVRFEVTEAVLNHVSGARSGVAGIYQRHDWREEKRAALDRWAKHLKEIVKSD